MAAIAELAGVFTLKEELFSANDIVLRHSQLALRLQCIEASDEEVTCG